MADDTNSGTCASISYKIHSTFTECFLQILALHVIGGKSLSVVNTVFTGNCGHISGSILYGGLLDRCTVSPFAEVYHKYDYDSMKRVPVDGVTYIVDSSNINDFDSIL